MHKDRHFESLEMALFPKEKGYLKMIENERHTIMELNSASTEINPAVTTMEQLNQDNQRAKENPSLLSLIAKLMIEHLISAHHQHGFRRCRSTSTVLQVIHD